MVIFLLIVLLPVTGCGIQFELASSDETNSQDTSGDTTNDSEDGSDSQSDDNPTVTEDPSTDQAISHHVSKAISVDGQVELAWKQQTEYAIAKIPWGEISSEEDLSGSFRIAWDEQSVYLVFEVFDDVLYGVPDSGLLWEADGIEVYFDMLHNGSDTYDELDYQIIFSHGHSEPGGILPATFNGYNLATTASAVGYTLELQLPWSSLGLTPSEGDVLGFEVMLNDNDDGVQRQAKRSWHGDDDMAHQIPSRFGDLLLAP